MEVKSEKLVRYVKIQMGFFNFLKRSDFVSVLLNGVMFLICCS